MPHSTNFIHSRLMLLVLCLISTSVISHLPPTFPSPALPCSPIHSTGQIDFDSSAPWPSSMNNRQGSKPQTSVRPPTVWLRPVCGPSSMEPPFKRTPPPRPDPHSPDPQTCAAEVPVETCPHRPPSLHLLSSFQLHSLTGGCHAPPLMSTEGRRERELCSPEDNWELVSVRTRLGRMRMGGAGRFWAVLDVRC